MVTINQIVFEEIESYEFDFLICASGFETRATFQSEKIHSKASTKYALGFKSEKNCFNRTKNDLFFQENNFIIQELDGDEKLGIEIRSILDLIFNHNISKNTKVYIDYSCMTKNWYSFLIYYLFNSNYLNEMRVYFGYSHAKYVQNENRETLNRIVEPIFGYCDFNIPSKPTALIIGLGNEANRTYGLTEYFDATSFLFYSDNSYNEEYSVEIELKNELILKSTNPEHIYKFPVFDLQYTNLLLENLCTRLVKEYRVVIAPCGPKPFALLSMINCLKNGHSIEVWRISPGSKLEAVDRIPTGLVSVLELVFN